MFDSGQTSHLLRSHSHNLSFSEEFNRTDRRTTQNTCEIKRKSGMFAVFFSISNEGIQLGYNKFFILIWV